MRYYHLLEAINSSEIDLLARKALRDEMMTYLEGEWNKFVEGFPSDDSGEAYDAFYRYWRSDERVGGEGTISREWAFSRRILDRASRCLSEVVRKYLLENHGDEVIINGNPVEVSLFRVKIEDRLDSIDVHKHAGGYFSPTKTKPIIKAFVNRDDVVAAGMAFVQFAAFGEGEGHESLVDLLGSVFVHEYVHLEQFIRGGLSQDSDHGYITAGGGKRGNRRSPRAGETASEKLISWMRYKGSAYEIEAFAQQAASEMIAQAMGYSRGRISNENIDDILRDISLGYGSSSALSSYSAIGWGDYGEQAKEAGINPREIQLTWQRFLKLLYRAVNSYRSSGIKRSRFTDDRVPEHWRNAAKENSFGKAARIIATDIAKTAKQDQPWKSADEALRYNEKVTHAEMFLYQAFFGKEFYEDENHFNAFAASFKRLTARLYDEIDLSNVK